MVDLFVNSGETVFLDEKPGNPFAIAHKEYKIENLKDLVNVGVVRSAERLNQLLDAAKAATQEVLTKKETYVPEVMIAGGLARIDLRRFGIFLAKTGGPKDPEKEIFWRTIRDVEATTLAQHTLTTKLGRFLRSTHIFFFNDITIEANGTLEIQPTVETLRANNITIKKAGKIKVNGNNLIIKAFSIKGEQ